MQWFNKFKVGQKVRVVKKVVIWNYGIRCRWNVCGYMDKTVGKVYEIIRINSNLGYLLAIGPQVGQNFWYPVESLSIPICVGQQLLFNFMNEKE